MAKKNSFHKSSSEQAIGAYNEKEYLTSEQAIGAYNEKEYLIPSIL